MSANAACDKCGKAIPLNGRYIHVAIAPGDEFNDDGASIFDRNKAEPEPEMRRRFRRRPSADYCISCFNEHAVADFGKVFDGGVPTRTLP